MHEEPEQEEEEKKKERNKQKNQSGNELGRRGLWIRGQIHSHLNGMEWDSQATDKRTQTKDVIATWPQKT